jgi:excisionase family DNA binding protein
MTDVGDEALKLYSVPEVARLLSLSKSTIWRLIAAGELESVKRGRSRRIAAEAVADYKASLVAAAKNAPAA